MALPCSCQHRCLMMTMMSSRTRSLRRLVAAAVAHWRRLLLLMLLLLFFSSSFCRSCCCCSRICLLSKPRRTSRRVPCPSRADYLRVESELRCVINLSVGDFYGPARHSPLPPIPPSCLLVSLQQLAAVYNQIINALPASQPAQGSRLGPKLASESISASPSPCCVGVAQRQRMDLLSLSESGRIVYHNADTHILESI